jgi:hypothetical protein
MRISKAVPMLLAVLGPSGAVHAQGEVDTIMNVIQLGDLVIRAQGNGFNVEGFVQQVMDDTTFQHAFLNTRYHPHRVKSLFRVRNKDERETASLYRRGRLVREGPVARIELDSVSEQGRLRERDGGLRYLTAEMYDDVFFPKGSWTASNRIAQRQQEIDRSSRFDKYKSELKKFMFNPGQEIASVPMIGDKLALFDQEMMPFYDYRIDQGFRSGHSCWVFSAVSKDTVDGDPADADDTVIKRMFTWFDQSGMQVVAREYRIAHASLILDFDISITVDNTLVNGELVPVKVTYDGVWDIPFKKREIVRFFLDYSDWQVP